MHANALDGRAGRLAATRHRATEPTAPSVDASEAAFAGTRLGDFSGTLGQTSGGARRIGDLARGVRFDRCTRAGQEGIALIDRVAEVSAARDDRVVRKLDLKRAQTVLVGSPAARPIAPTAELATAAASADRARNAIRPLRARFAVGPFARPLAAWCDAGPRREWHAGKRPSVRCAAAPRLVVANAGRTELRAIRGWGDLAAAVEQRLSRGRATAICGIRWVAPVLAARGCGDESPCQDRKREKTASYVHEAVSYEKRTALATDPDFAEAVPVCSGALPTNGPDRALENEIDTPPFSHSRFEVGMCDLAGRERHARFERRFPL